MSLIMSERSSSHSLRRQSSSVLPLSSSIDSSTSTVESSGPRRKRNLRFGYSPKPAESPAPNAYYPETGCYRGPRWSMQNRNPRGSAFDTTRFNVRVAPGSYDLPSALNISPKRPQGCPSGGRRFPRDLSRSPGPCAYTPKATDRTVYGVWGRGERGGVTSPEESPSPVTYRNVLPPITRKVAVIGRDGLMKRRKETTEPSLIGPGSTLNMKAGRSFGHAPPRGVAELVKSDLGPGAYGSFLRHYSMGRLKNSTTCQGRNPPGCKWMGSCLDSDGDTW